MASRASHRRNEASGPTYRTGSTKVPGGLRDDEVERILVVLDLGVEAREVEAVREIFLVYLTEILVSPGRNKLQVWLERGASKVW